MLVSDAVYIVCCISDCCQGRGDCQKEISSQHVTKLCVLEINCCTARKNGSKTMRFAHSFYDPIFSRLKPYTNFWKRIIFIDISCFLIYSSPQNIVCLVHKKLKFSIEYFAFRARTTGFGLQHTSFVFLNIFSRFLAYFGHVMLLVLIFLNLVCV